jgi:hypothetical protein
MLSPTGNMWQILAPMMGSKLWMVEKSLRPRLPSYFTATAEGKPPVVTGEPTRASNPTVES